MENIKNYKLIDDYISFDVTFEKGTVLQLNENGKHYLIKNDFQIGFTEEQLIKNTLFEEIKPIDISSKEIDNDMEKDDKMIVKKWRIQLDIVTTEEKRQLIQKEIQDVINKIL